MRTALLFMIFVVLAMLPSPAGAQYYSNILQRLIEMNQHKPLQDPSYERSNEILSRRVLDNTNRVVGEVRDVLVNKNGNIVSLKIDFNRLRLGEPVYLNYRNSNMRPVSDGYEIGFTDDRIEDIYPDLLADIETASGKDDDVFSVRKIIGAEVEDNKGRKLGKVKEVLFSSSGNRADALYIDMTYGKTRGQSMAVPFGMARFEDDFSGKVLKLTEDQGDAMIDFAESKK